MRRDPMGRKDVMVTLAGDEVALVPREFHIMVQTRSIKSAQSPACSWSFMADGRR